MKIKIASSDINQVFEYLDTNKDGYINYLEFCELCEEKRKNIDPFNSEEANDMMTKKKELANKTFDAMDLEHLERMSVASKMYKGFKSNKLKSGSLATKLIAQNHSFGVGTLPSDNMGKILTHEFEKEFVNQKEHRQKIDKERYEINKILKRGQHTKASKIR